MWVTIRTNSLSAPVVTRGVELVNKEGGVTQKTFWRGVLVVFLCLALAAPVDAQILSPSYGKIENTAIIGGAVAVVAVVVIVAVVVTRKKKITGCVHAGDNGLSIMNEKDKLTYELAGNTAGIKAGGRVTLQGKKLKSKDKAKPLTWQVDKLTKDFGSCRP